MTGVRFFLGINKMNNKVLGFFPVLMLVIGSIVGAGIFNSPADLGGKANPGPIMVAWLLTGIGVFSIAMIFQFLSRAKPELEGGIYSYAREGFGEFVGFNSAWGYWWAAMFGNLAYFTAILKISSGYFPIIEQNKIVALLVASVILWSYYALIRAGIRVAGVTNAIITTLKLLPLLVVIFVCCIAFKPELFSGSLFSTTVAGSGTNVTIGNQVNDCFFVMLWTFIGIESAVVLSNKARSQKIVATATLVGFAVTMFIYVTVSTMSMGVIEAKKLVDSSSPLGTLLGSISWIGKPGQWLLDFGFLFSVMGAMLSWLLLASETPYIAAVRGNAFPKAFAGQNERATPVFSLTVTDIITQTVLILLFVLSDTGRIENSKSSVLQNLYAAAISLAGIMILLPYLFSTIFGFRTALKERKYLYLVFAVLGTVYAVWVIYALRIYAAAAVILYTPGIIVYKIAKKERGEKLVWGELVTYGLLAIASIVSIYYIVQGQIKF